MMFLGIILSGGRKTIPIHRHICSYIFDNHPPLNRYDDNGRFQTGSSADARGSNWKFKTTLSGERKMQSWNSCLLAVYITSICLNKLRRKNTLHLHQAEILVVKRCCAAAISNSKTHMDETTFLHDHPPKFST